MHEVEVDGSIPAPGSKKEILMTQNYIDIAIVLVLVILWIMLIKEKG